MFVNMIKFTKNLTKKIKSNRLKLFQKINQMFQKIKPKIINNNNQENNKKKC